MHVNDLAIPPAPSEVSVIQRLRATMTGVRLLQSIARSMERGAEPRVEIAVTTASGDRVSFEITEPLIFSGLVDELEQQTEAALLAMGVSVDPHF